MHVTLSCLDVKHFVTWIEKKVEDEIEDALDGH